MASQKDHQRCGPADLEHRRGGGLSWYRCTRCGFVFNSRRPGHTALVLRAYGRCEA